jgi:tetratricopeptide (TPR) repeat protein
LLLCLLTLPQLSPAQESCEPVAQIISAQGEIRVNGVLIANSEASRDRLTVCTSDIISAGELSRAAIAILDSETVIRIDQNSELRLTALPAKDPSFLRLVKGAINILSPAPQALEVDAGFVNAAVEGTEFHIRVEDDRAIVTVLEGQVRASNANGDPVSLATGESASALAGQAPRRDASVIPRETIQWALYYPPVIDFAAVPSGLSPDDPQFHTREAARNLSVGAVDLAEESIAAASRLDNTNEEVWALRLIIALTQSRTADIDRLMEGASANRFSSAAALIALSYAQQRQFQLQTALETLNKAVEADSRSWLAKARRSELWLSVGNIDRALEDAQAANDLKANARSETVLGFAYLAQSNTAAAAEAFRQAIAMGSEDPLPHLGLGLAKIREGDLSEGRREIEHALAIDSENALVRSYLGKAFYEEKRAPLDELKFAQSKKQDPNDPTPWFYDAIRKQSINRPIEALDDLQKSIELNDNRAVYRSRLLLDEDLAARSASLGRIYRDMGFEQRGLVEGWKSVSTEPSNFSGHRFLADVYSTLPRHQIARANELFQSQLLQPSNMTPIQPQLGEANLFVLDSAGPSEIAFSEFNPLFNRNRIGFQVSGVAGGNGTLGDDIALYGVTDRWSYSLGQFHFGTDGFRENNDLTQDIFNAFVQFRPSFKTSLQAEIRHTDTEKGDLALRFDPEDYSADLRLSEKVDSVRFGLKHAFTNRSKLLGSLIYQESEGSLDVPPVLSIDTQFDGYRVEGQYIFDGDLFDITGGVNYLSNDASDFVTAVISVPFPPYLIESYDEVDTSADHLSAYLYALIRYANQVTLTLGGTADFLDSWEVNKNTFSPKLGLLWEPGPRTTIRAAIFRTIQRPFISKQNVQPSLEPSQVAGFTQFFFGAQGEEAWRYGLGIDQEFTGDVFGGVEYSSRAVETPVPEAGPLPGSSEMDIDEKLGRAYLYWAPSPRFAAGAEYQYEDVDNNDVFVFEGTGKLRTHRLTLKANYFHPSGFSCGLEAANVDQEGEFEDIESGLAYQGGDRFFVLDASLGYRLPKRYGIVSLSIKNLLDESFQFQDTDPENPSVTPGRWVLLNFTVALGS